MVHEVAQKDKHSLTALADAINLHHRQALAQARSALELARHVGGLLLEAKSQLGHGGWLPWLSENCTVSPRQAQRYMRVAESWDTITAKYEVTSHLTIDRAAKIRSADQDEPQQLLIYHDNGIEYEDCDEDTQAEEPSPKKLAHVANNSGDNEWYTPQEYVDSARAVLGSIDLDPASSEIAQRTVEASTFFTADDDGLSQDWSGNVFLNPPYARELIGRFTEKLCGEVKRGAVRSAIMLTNNSTDTSWFRLASSHATAVCFFHGRISFIHRDGQPGKPLQGQMGLYFGNDAAKFVQVFNAHGSCWMKPSLEGASDE